MYDKSKFYFGKIIPRLLFIIVLSLIVYFPILTNGGFPKIGWLFEAKEYSAVYNATAKSRLTNNFEIDCNANVFCFYDKTNRNRIYSVSSITVCYDNGDYKTYNESLTTNNHITPFEWNDFTDEKGVVWKVKLSRSLGSNILLIVYLMVPIIILCALLFSGGVLQYKKKSNREKFMDRLSLPMQIKFAKLIKDFPYIEDYNGNINPYNGKEITCEKDYYDYIVSQIIDTTSRKL